MFDTRRCGICGAYIGEEPCTSAAAPPKESPAATFDTGVYHVRCWNAMGIIRSVQD